MEEINETVTTQKRKIGKEELLEILVAIFLGITAFATAWGSWIGSLHGGNQATNYTTSNNLSSEGNSMYNEAAQDLMQDMITWNSISQVRIDYAFASANNDVLEMEKLEYKLNQLISDNCSEEMQEAINWADAQEEYASPFDKEGYVESYFAEASDVLVEADEALEQGKKDNANGDSFGLATVVYSVVLFLLGIVGTFKRLPNRFIILGVAIAAFLAATIYMFTIPMPTGFSITSFFSH